MPFYTTLCMSTKHKFVWFRKPFTIPAYIKDADNQLQAVQKYAARQEGLRRIELAAAALRQSRQDYIQECTEWGRLLVQLGNEDSDIGGSSLTLVSTATESCLLLPCQTHDEGR